MNDNLYDHNLASSLIEAYCSEHSINESDFAALINVHPGSLSRIKAGKMCSPETLAKIAALGRITIGQLMRDSPSSVRDELVATGKAKNIPVSV